jgi:hypothetical protein
MILIQGSCRFCGKDVPEQRNNCFQRVENMNKSLMETARLMSSDTVSHEHLVVLVRAEFNIWKWGEHSSAALRVLSDMDENVLSLTCCSLV